MLTQEFRILSLNIHKGFALGPKRLVLSRIRECLRDSGANIVFLQEVIGVNHRHQRNVVSWPSQTQLEYLADSVWTHHAYGRNAIYQHGHHGNAILSELPFVHWDNIDASIFNFSQRGFLHGTVRNTTIRNTTARGEREGNLHLICVHLGLFEHERRKQITHLIEYIERQVPHSEPLILAGDFNDWRHTGHRRLCSALGLEEVHESCNGNTARTYPAFMPMLAMDRIYLRGLRVSQCSSIVGEHWREFSDHRALLASVRITGC
jgi:endonuclease/exonuclease/phosphatase family metal-dependent hydrolase